MTFVKHELKPWTQRRFEEREWTTKHFDGTTTKATYLTAVPDEPFTASDRKEEK